VQRGDVDRFKVPKGVGKLTAGATWSVDDALVVVLGLD
jgi:hypothetical protein